MANYVPGETCRYIVSGSEGRRRAVLPACTCPSRSSSSCLYAASRGGQAQPGERRQSLDDADMSSSSTNGADPKDIRMRRCTPWRPAAVADLDYADVVADADPDPSGTAGQDLLKRRGRPPRADRAADRAGAVAASTTMTSSKPAELLVVGLGVGRARPVRRRVPALRRGCPGPGRPTRCPSARVGRPRPPAPRGSSPPGVAGPPCSTDDPADRAGHAHGKAYRDVVRNLHGQLDAPARPGGPPARPRPTSSTVLDWCRRRTASPSSPTAAAARWSAASSRRFDGHAGVVSLDLTRPRPGARDRPRPAGPPGSRPARSARHSRTSCARTAHAAALPAELRVLDARRLAGHPRRRPLRHPPHPHRRPRRVDAGGDAGRASASRGGCPGSGAGPSPDRLFLGSEGTLGVITEAWMRLQDRPG